MGASTKPTPYYMHKVHNESSCTLQNPVYNISRRGFNPSLNSEHYVRQQDSIKLIALLNKKNMVCSEGERRP